MLSQAEVPCGRDRVTDAGAPAEAVHVSGDWLDDHRMLDTGHSPQLLTDQFPLQPPLCGKRDVLPVTAPAAAGAGVAAGRGNPSR